MWEAGIWSGVINRRHFIWWCTGLAYNSSSLDGSALSSLIQSREGTEDPKQIIRPEIVIIAVNLSNYCNI